MGSLGSDHMCVGLGEIQNLLYPLRKVQISRILQYDGQDIR